MVSEGTACLNKEAMTYYCKIFFQWPIKRAPPLKENPLTSACLLRVQLPHKGSLPPSQYYGLLHE